MLVEDLDDVIVLENENGDRWVDRADDWKKLNP
jgi:hypothetical protein